MITKWLTKTEVMKLVGSSRYLLDKAIQSGQRKYQIINKSMLFTERDVEEWQTNTHTDFISEGITSTPISRSYPKPDNGYSFERVLDKWKNKRQINTALKDLVKSDKLNAKKLAESSQV